MTKFKGETD